MLVVIIMPMMAIATTIIAVRIITTAGIITTTIITITIITVRIDTGQLLALQWAAGQRSLDLACRWVARKGRKAHG